MNNSKILKLNSVAKNVLKNYIEASKSSEMGVARVEIIPIQEIQLVENNPNKHSEEHLDDLASSINKYGLMVPVLKNSKNQLITGEGRYRSLLKLSPAYDLTYSSSFNGEHATTIDGEGKNPNLDNILSVAKNIGLKEKLAKDIASEIKNQCTGLQKYRQ